MRTVWNLTRLDGRVFVYLYNETVRMKFLEDATKEGFTFGDGVSPLERPGDDIYAIKKNHTLNFVGWAGHMAFRNPEAVVGEPLIRVDYERYILGFEEYRIQEEKEDEKED